MERPQFFAGGVALVGRPRGLEDVFRINGNKGVEVTSGRDAREQGGNIGFDGKIAATDGGKSFTGGKVGKGYGCPQSDYLRQMAAWFKQVSGASGLSFWAAFLCCCKRRRSMVP